MSTIEAVELLESLDHQREVVRRLIQMKINKGKRDGFRVPASAHKILSIVADVTGVSISDIVSKNRSQDIKNARHIAAYVMFTDLGWTKSKAGEAVGRDHSTVIHSINFISDALWRVQYGNAKEDAKLIENLRDVQTKVKMV